MCQLVQHRCKNWAQCGVNFSQGYAEVCRSQNNKDPLQLRRDRSPGFCGEGVETSWWTDGSYCGPCGARRAVQLYDEVFATQRERKLEILLDGTGFEERLAEFDQAMLQTEQSAARGRALLQQHEEKQREEAACAQWEEEYARQHPSPPMTPSDNQWLIARQVEYMNMRQNVLRMVHSWVGEQGQGGSRYQQWSSANTVRTRPPSEVSSEKHEQRQEGDDSGGNPSARLNSNHDAGFRQDGIY